MPHERFYLNSPLEGTIFLEEKEFHHLIHVMRMKEGETIELINGNGALAEGVIKTIGKKRAECTITSTKTHPKCNHELILAQALPRSNRLETILEKGTELGVTSFWLFPGDKSERTECRDEQLERYRLILISALKQCGRLFLPSIEWRLPLTKWKELPAPLFFGDLAKDATFLHQVPSSLIFAIGPESGWSEKEIDKLHALNGKGIHLSPYVLRTDTAAITAAALITHSWNASSDKPL